MKRYVLLLIVVIAAGCAPTEPALIDIDQAATQTAAAGMVQASPTEVANTSEPTQTPTLTPNTASAPTEEAMAQPHATPTPQVSLTTRRETVTYHGPSTQYAVHSTWLPGGETYAVMARNSKSTWLMIDASRWVATWVVAINGDPNKLPVAEVSSPTLAPPETEPALPEIAMLGFEPGTSERLYMCPDISCTSDLVTLSGDYFLTARDTAADWVRLDIGGWLWLPETAATISGDVMDVPIIDQDS